MAINFTQKGVDKVKEAAAKDNAQQYLEAVALYKHAIEFFQASLTYDKNLHADMRKWLSMKIDEVQKRIALLEENGALDSGGGTAQATKGKKQKEEDEDAKFRGALESAIMGERPDVKWSDIAGLEGAKDALREAVILPMKVPQMFNDKRVPWKGILMYGPPGTGKSYLASAVATECASTFFKISSADIMSKWVGESEKLVRTLFKLAREQKPSVIFIDEVDSLCSTRGSGDSEAGSRVKTEFLVQMQGVGHDDRGLLVLAATNLPYQLDSAVRRRFERRIEIPLPDAVARAEMFRIHLGDTEHSICQQQFAMLADKADGYSGSDISVLVRNALMEPIRTCQLAMHFREITVEDEDPEMRVRWLPCSPGDSRGKEMTLMEVPKPKCVVPPPVQYDDFVKAFVAARPSVSKDDLLEVQRFTREFGQQGSEQQELPNSVGCQTDISYALRN